MRYYLLVLVVLFTSCSQDIIIKEYYESGEIRSICRCIDNNNCSSKTFFHKNGQIETELPLVNNKIEGEVKGYYDSGELYSKVNYVNNNREGVKQYYYKDQSTKAINLYYRDSLFYLKSFPLGKNEYNDQIIPIITLDTGDGGEVDSLFFTIAVPFIDGFPFIDDELYVNYEILKSETEGRDLPPSQLIFSKEMDAYIIKVANRNGLDIFGLIKAKQAKFEHYFKKQLTFNNE